ncbi:MAG: hypothetical protein GY928_36155 [Colwellia sp.]|nr:hypothetical protein [Colwellia sp.]
MAVVLKLFNGKESEVTHIRAKRFTHNPRGALYYEALTTKGRWAWFYKKDQSKKAKKLLPTSRNLTTWQNTSTKIETQYTSNSVEVSKVV